LLLGIHLAWERHRFRLETPKGIIWVGMTHEQVWAILGPSFNSEKRLEPSDTPFLELWIWEKDSVGVCFNAGRVEWASSYTESYIPRPSLLEHVRSWFKREE
jgi:hypothetical protein